jgi:hypothetical protein
MIASNGEAHPFDSVLLGRSDATKREYVALRNFGSLWWWM